MEQAEGSLVVGGAEKGVEVKGGVGVAKRPCPENAAFSEAFQSGIAGGGDAEHRSTAAEKQLTHFGVSVWSSPKFVDAVGLKSPSF